MHKRNDFFRVFFFFSSVAQTSTTVSSAYIDKVRERAEQQLGKQKLNATLKAIKMCKKNNMHNR